MHRIVNTIVLGLFGAAILALLAAVFLLATSFHAGAQYRSMVPVMCGSANEVEKMLKETYAESPIWVGAAGTSTAFLTQSADGGWTIYVRGQDGSACVLGSGQNGQTVDPDPAPPKPDGSNS